MQGVNTPGADLTQHRVALGVYIPSFSNSEVCVHSPPHPQSFPAGSSHTPPLEKLTWSGVFYHLLSSFPCALSPLPFQCPVNFQQNNLCRDYCLRGLLLGGTQTKTCSSSVLTPRHFLPGRGKYSMQKKQQLNEKQSTVFFKELGKHPMFPSAWGEMLGGESEFRLKEGS